MNQIFSKIHFNFDKKTITLAKIGMVTFLTVYGGHKLVQFVSPTEEELLQVLSLNYHIFLIFIYFKRFSEERRNKYLKRIEEKEKSLK